MQQPFEDLSCLATVHKHQACVIGLQGLSSKSGLAHYAVSVCQNQIHQHSNCDLQREAEEFVQPQECQQENSTVKRTQQSRNLNSEGRMGLCQPLMLLLITSAHKTTLALASTRCGDTRPNHFSEQTSQHASLASSERGLLFGLERLSC